MALESEAEKEEAKTLEEEARLLNEKSKLTEEIEQLNRAWLGDKPIRSHEEIAKDYAQEFKMNLTDAKKMLDVYQTNIKFKDILYLTLLKR